MTRLSVPSIRTRTPEDVGPLADVLMAQQPTTRYPVRNPLPFPVAQFLHAEDAVAAWTAEHDGRVVGHACWLRTTDAASQQGAASGSGRRMTGAEACAAAHGCAEDELAWVSALFVDPAARGLGVGRALLATVVDDIRRAGAHPCLEVVDLNEAAVRRYRVDGWQEVLRARPDWLAASIADPTIGTSIMVLPGA